ncbi:MAG TPA: hypothetical protein VES64_09950 [Allosphingosinicella sp.]|nr:hypothetical protein [Allosphingosinicella sp.]
MWYAADDDPPPAVCGELNAKNRFGAYTGFRRFLVVLGDPPNSWIDDPARAAEIDQFRADGVDENLLVEMQLGLEAGENLYRVFCERSAREGVKGEAS